MIFLEVSHQNQLTIRKSDLNNRIKKDRLFIIFVDVSEFLCT